MGIIAQEYSLFEIDQGLDLLMEEIEPELMDRFQQFCATHGEKADRIGRFCA